MVQGRSGASGRTPTDIIDSARSIGQVVKVGPKDLALELRKLLRKGLPVDLARAGAVLPNLRSVAARSVHPDDLVSRLDALNHLLMRILAVPVDEPRAEAARVLFGVARGTAGRNLTQRRAATAALLGYDPDHFRKHIEPKIVDELAVALHRDLLRYKTRAARAPESLEPTGSTPSLNETHFTHQEELVSRIWEKVYALRAELIGAGRHSGEEGYELRAEEHRQSALRVSDELRKLLGEYRDAYGDALILHGDLEFAAEGLGRLVSWQLG